MSLVLLCASYVMAAIVLLFNNSMDAMRLNALLLLVWLAFFFLIEFLEYRKDKADKLNTSMLVETLRIQEDRIADLESEVLKLEGYPVRELNMHDNTEE